MSDKPSAGATGGTGLLAAGIVIAVVIAAGSYLAFQDRAQPTEEDLTALVPPAGSAPSGDSSTADDTETQVEVVETPAPETSAEEAATEGASAEPSLDLAQTAPPTIDEVRLDQGGVAVIAGRASPGSLVEVLLDGVVVASAEADGSGAFAALGTVDAADSARVLSLRATQDGAAVASQDEVIIAPVAQTVPEDIAEEQPHTAKAQQDDTGRGDEPDATASTVEEGVAKSEVQGATDVADADQFDPPAPASEAPARVETDEATVDLDQSGPSDTVGAPVSTEVAVASTETTDAAISMSEVPAAEETATVNDRTATDDKTASEVSTNEDTPTSIETPSAQARAKSPVDVTDGQQASAGLAPPKPEAAPAPDLVSAPKPEPETPAQVPDTVAGENTQLALLKSDAEGVTLLQADPVPPSTVMLDTISYSDDGIVQLSGRASGETEVVRVYLNNRAVADLPVNTRGIWRSDIPGVEPGVYTLRLDALGKADKVLSRIETPFRREAPAQLAAVNEQASGPVRSVTVQTGDTLWAIARDRYGEGVLYVQVFNANRSDILDPHLIYPGQVFALPDE